MTSANVCVLRAPGTNCDLETAHAFELCGARADRVHLFPLLETPRLLSRYQILCVPGGFSYGDDISAGVIFAKELSARLGEALAEFLRADKLALGICNGFQVLLKAGLLTGGHASPPSSEPADPPVTLTWNDNGQYTAVWVRLRVTNPENAFLRGLDEIELPVAHAEGKVLLRDGALLETWRRTGRIALCYDRRTGPAENAETPETPSTVLPYPDNPNGSVGNIAGLSDPAGRVLGLMPHPERSIHSTQHPQWARRGLQGEGAGLKLFRNAVEYFE